MYRIIGTAVFLLFFLVLQVSAAGATNTLLTQHGARVRSAPQPSKLVYRGTTKGRFIALTFDAGSDRGYTARILGYLRGAAVRGTFGITGKWAERNPDLIRQMAKYGEQIVNHSYGHPSFTGYSTRGRPLSERNRIQEIQRADTIIRRLTGRSTKPYFRPPYGDTDPALLRLTGRLGYRYLLMWTVDSLGWKGISTTQIVQRCLTKAQPGAIILMHVGSQSRDALALPKLISQLKQRGYRFATASQIVR